jgi:enoyl-CoA hydratase/carnithine racemase
VRLQDTMSSSGTMRLCTAAWGSLQFFSGFTDLRMLQAPVVCAAHGVVLGGGLAVALLTDYIVAEAAASFQVGELPRGIAPAGLLLLTLADAVGRARATSLYLSDKKLTAQAALAQRLVQEVREGTDATQEHALNLAFCFALSSCLELFKTNFLVGSAALSEYERATLAVGSFAQVGSAFCLPASASCSTSMLSSSCHIRHASFRYCIRECVLACTGEKCP